MRILKVLVVNALLIGLVLVAAELTARQLEGQNVSTVPVVGPDPELGWAPVPNARGHVDTREFSVDIRTNSLGLNGRPIDERSKHSGCRILALGDSHTAATGVSSDDAWPNALERILGEDGADLVTVHNAGVGAYSLDQYLVRFRKLQPVIEPDLVIVGFSTATDFYDLGRLPGGDFVYGSGIGRIYFSLDDKGSLVEHDELIGKTFETTTADRSLSLTLRGWLGEFALYRLVKRSELAMWLAVRLAPGGESLWPGLDTALKIRPGRRRRSASRPGRSDHRRVGRGSARRRRGRDPPAHPLPRPGLR
jgi:hypothetical protein